MGFHRGIEEEFITFTEEESGRTILNPDGTPII